VFNELKHDFILTGKDGGGQWLLRGRAERGEYFGLRISDCGLRIEWSVAQMETKNPKEEDGADRACGAGGG
jgi:hypothetical protein